MSSAGPAAKRLSVGCLRSYIEAVGVAAGPAEAGRFVDALVAAATAAEA